ncbi:DUF3159 domain-containing protein [Brachybacterium sp. GPGPB12]|uniref:DUF3159 domain-containing protein n=1 Tax=Brachybacterium sp. GPGPB12 TaxID=3023517 RepID=UPI00313459A5
MSTHRAGGRPRRDRAAASPAPAPAAGSSPRGDSDAAPSPGADAQDASPAGQRPAVEPAGGEGSTRGGLGAVLQEEEFSVADAIGGRRGIVESVSPTPLFVVLFVATGAVGLAAGAAVAAVVVMLVVRLVQRQSPSTVIGGLIGVALGAVLAVRSGEGSDFYWPGIVTNAVSLAVLLLSLALRHPLVGVVVAPLDPRVSDWREHEDGRRVYTRATLLFAGLYAAKLAVRLPPLLTGQVAALGAAKIAMGLPAFAVIAYLVWLMHRGSLARRGHR